MAANTIPNFELAMNAEKASEDCAPNAYRELCREWVAARESILVFGERGLDVAEPKIALSD
jgi:hypothetical protein